jgi:peptidyl-prolyl cis-trans isomerase A (cyclophilin A)
MKSLSIAVLLALCACSCRSAHEEQMSDQAVGPAPAVFRVKLDTTKGPVVIEAHRTWAPFGTDRFYELVQKKFFDGAAFFRVVKGFVVQFGISPYPEVAAHWRPKTIQDDPVKETNARGTVVFATSGPNTRTTQLFINLANNAQLDSQGFSPFGRVVEGMDVVDKINAEYGEAPEQPRIESEGNDYLKSNFPNLDYIKTARVIQP